MCKKFRGQSIQKKSNFDIFGLEKANLATLVSSVYLICIIQKEGRLK